MRRFKTILRSKYFFKILAVIFIGYSVLSYFFLEDKSYYTDKNTDAVGVVTKYEIDGNQCVIYLKAQEKLVVYYYFVNEEEKNYYQNKLELGMIMKVEGDFQKPSKNTVPNGFHYYHYLQTKKINYVVYADFITIKNNNTSIGYYLKNKIIKRIDRIDKTGYFRTFILGDKSLLESSVMKKYQNNGVSHLFSISGMHISLIVSILFFFLNKVSYSSIYKYSIIIPILLFYLFLTDYSSSIIRTVIMFLLFAIDEMWNLKVKKLDVMLLVLVVAIGINKFIIFDVGFQFSYVISFSLILLQKKIGNVRGKILNCFCVSVVCFLVSFPICVYHFYQVNVISILLNLVIIPLVSVVIFPLTLITFVIPIIYPIYQFLVLILERINELASCITVLEFVFMKPNFMVVILYYLIIVLIFWKKQFLLLLFLLVCIHKGYSSLDNQFIFTMLDVGQGDSLFIKYPYNKGNILIDTGGNVTVSKENWMIKKEENSIVLNKTISYLKSLGITKLDYLILTHGDYDHMGEAKILVENFKAEKVIFNCGEFNELEQELIKVLDKKKIKYYSCVKELNIDDNKLYFLNNGNYDNENDNSSVIYTILNNYKFLFMGDAGVEVEEKILSKYNINNIDVLKVGHHGSRTSSSREFIDEIHPKYGLISVGKNNRYGHPNKEALNSLKDTKIYRTDQYGSVIFKIKNNKLKIDTCSP